jgi:DNA processing protein
MNLFAALLPKAPAPGAFGDAQRLDWLRLSRAQGVGPATFRRLLEAYGTADAALEALPELAARGGRTAAPKIPERAQVEREAAALRRAGGRLVVLCESAYPPALAQCEDAPPVLQVLGNPALLARPCIGIVGARNASLHGRRLAEAMARDLAAEDWAVVSGMARGIDAAAHTGALEGGTVAVLAGGADVVYPTENARLYDALRARGCIVAESPLGQKPFAQSFPRRNRIISGLSRGLVVVECTLRSGSLITARLAGEQGREVMAVPGFPGDPRAAGPNALLRDGAVLVRHADDVREALAGGTIPARHAGLAEPPIPPLAAPPPEAPPEDVRAAVVEALSTAPAEVDALIRALDAPAQAVQTVLLELELAGRAQRLPGGRVALR